MTSISIIGTGNMARTIGTLAVAGGNTVEVMGRDPSKAADLAKALGGGTTTGEWGAVPAGDIVIVAVLYDSVVPIVAEYGDALAGKAIIDISNPFNPAADGLAIHRSTLRYRLQRIREVSGLDLGDVDSRFNLHAATRAWRVLGG